LGGVCQRKTKTVLVTGVQKSCSENKKKCQLTYQHPEHKQESNKREAINAPPKNTGLPGTRRQSVRLLGQREKKHKGKRR